MRVAVDTGGDAIEAIEEHRAHICAETLAMELCCAPPPDGWTTGVADLEDGRVSITLIRA